MSKTVFITGASSGIGLATAKMFLEKGWNVIGTSRAERNIDGIRMIKMELLDLNSIKEAFAAAGDFDVMVQCAGSGTAGAFEDFSQEQLKHEIETDFTGALMVIKEAIACLRKRGGGKIVAVGSVAGRIPLPYQSIYSACKAGISAAIHALRLEVKQFGITMSVIEPGDTKTGFTGARVFTKDIEDSPYRKECSSAIAQFEKDEMHGKSPETAARAIYKAATKKHPSWRSAVCLKYKFLCVVAAALPSRLRDWVLRLMYLKK